MTPQEVFGLLAGRFGADVGPLVAGEAGADAGLPKGWRAVTPFAWVKPARIRDVCRYCHDALGFDSLSCLSGVDAKGLAKDHPDELWVVYHLSSVSSRDAFALKVRLDRADPRLPSIHDVWGVANWHEREAYDMFGIVFEGHPNPTRILCCDDWVGWPLRKDYVFPKAYHGIPHARRPSPSWTGPAPWEKAK